MNQLTNNQFFSENGKRYLIFALSDKKYAMEATQVLEVLNLPELVVPQKLPIFICGLLKYNNIIINVIDSYRALDLPERQFSTDDQLLLIKTDDTIFGLVVDNVIDLIEISSDNIHPKTYNAENTVIKCISFINDEMIFILDSTAMEKYIKAKSDTFLDTSSNNRFAQDENSKEIFENRKLTFQNKKNYISPELYIDTTDYIWFLIGNNNYCIKIDFVQEIINSGNDLTTLPGSPNFINGVICHHGYFYTIVNLANFLDSTTNTSTTEGEKIIIINDTNFKIGFLVDKILGIKKFSNDDLINSVNKKSKNKFYSHEIIIDNQLFYIIDLKNILVDSKLLIFDITKV